ncbi:MAG: DNA mismatch repair endonuclease MutL [Aeromonadales bacterium]|nr:DNA mismatch repair endonuclease MutL [Aeromonadales bacterium]
MANIRLLSKQLASQIAAGEVVERPSSVVKELLENAVDAKATHILCEIRQAGKILIRVRDDGAGIEKEDLPLALAPHATSKIRTADDLASIETLGFRGEALASIASVSKLTLTSKTKYQENAYQVCVEGPEQSPVVTPAAHPTGTTVDVMELFFNTPARRRFLKSDRTEFLRIKDIFVRVALAHPELAFELVSDNKCIFKVSKANVEQGLDHRRTAALIGSNFSSEGIGVICEDPNLKIEGMLLPPAPEEACVSEQIYLFLNGRPIADKVVTHALKEGFYEVLGKTLPIRCVLYLQLDPATVDVNVHPRKDEVRFHETSLIHDLITDSIVLALKKANIGPVQNSLFQDLESPIAPAPSKYELNTPASHASSFDINNEKLPAFPAGVSSIIDINSFADRGNPIIRSSSSESGNAPVYRSNISKDNLEDIKHNINIFKSSVSASSIGSSANLNLETQVNNFSYRSSVVYLDLVTDNVALVKENRKYYLVNLDKVKEYLQAKDYIERVKDDCVEMVKLTMPFAVRLDETLIKGLKIAEKALKRCGFELELGKTKAQLVSIPTCLKGSDLASVSGKTFNIISASYKSLEDGICPYSLACAIASFSSKNNLMVLAKDLLTNIESLGVLKNHEGAYQEISLSQLAIKFGGGF